MVQTTHATGLESLSPAGKGGGTQQVGSDTAQLTHSVEVSCNVLTSSQGSHSLFHHGVQSGGELKFTFGSGATDLEGIPGLDRGKDWPRGCVIVGVRAS